jgi:predicted permease
VAGEQVFIQHNMQMTRFRFWLWLIRVIGVIVPRRLRADWQHEWESELKHREELLAEWDRLNWRSKLDLIRRSLGAFRDALWMQSYRWEDEMIQDLRFSLRMMLKNKGFTCVAVLTLALGIGANTAIFSVVNALLLRPLPYQNSERLVAIWSHSPGANIEQDWLSPGQYSAIQSQTDVFDEMALAIGGSVNLAGQGEPQRLGVVYASSTIFPLLGVNPLIGRSFTPEESVPGKHRAVMLGYGLWQRSFGADPNVIGQSITLNSNPHTVVGILPEGFSLDYEVLRTVAAVEKIDMLLPLPIDAEMINDQGSENYNVLARLKPDVTLQQAQAQLDVVVTRLQQEHAEIYPANRGFNLSARTLLEQVVGDIRLALLVLLGAVGFVLLIACANVANLMLTRAAVREKEIAIRLALGAGPARLLRQLLTESVVLSLLGGGAGLLIAFLGIDLLRWLNPGNIPRIGEIHMDEQVLIFTFVVSILTGMLFGLAPALRNSRMNLNETLKEGGRSGSSGRHRLRNLLVISEIALSLVLLTGAGLLIRSFAHVWRVNPGFDAQNLITLRLSVVGTAYVEEPKREIFCQQLWNRIRQMPGVEAAGSTAILPFTNGASWGNIAIEGHNPAPGEESIMADQRVASTQYFEAMKIPLIRGRYFADQDTKGAMRVAVIDENMARRFWPDEDPVGKRIKRGRVDSENPWMTIVGVVGSVKQYALDTDSRIALYTPYSQDLYSTMYIVARTTGDPMALAAAITKEARSMDANTPIYDIKRMDERLNESMARRRFAMLSLGLFATVAILLAGVGIYGVISYSVTQRTREIGIRIALGARAQDVLRMVVRQGMLMAAGGVITGLVAALALTRLMTSLLFGVGATDPLTLAGVSTLVVFIALLACWIPARRATKVDPMIALRCD